MRSEDFSWEEHVTRLLDLAAISVSEIDAMKST